jgi:hypothetical protein
MVEAIGAAADLIRPVTAPTRTRLRITTREMVIAPRISSTSVRLIRMGTRTVTGTEINSEDVKSQQRRGAPGELE